MTTDVSPATAGYQDTGSAKLGLRLWPGIAVVALLWLVRLGTSFGEPSPLKFFVGLMIAPLVALLLVNLWWLLASRLLWSDRLVVAGALAVVAGATIAVSRTTFPPMALILYAVPVIVSLWVGWLLVSFWLSWPIRKYVLIGLFAVTGVCYSLLRVDGMDGTFHAAMHWRWTPTSEEKLLAELASKPAAAAKTVETDKATDDAKTAEPAVEHLELQPGDWPGFRGAARDGRLSGVTVATDWAKSPPRELWRRRVGPGWSSFAVVGDRLFTEEQRGEEELVVCYDANSGQQRWAHADATRFNELVAGPGPRGTPTFYDGRIYSLGANGNLHCLDAATGKPLWSKDILTDSGAKVPQWGYSGSPLVAEGIVTVFAGGPKGKSVLGYRAADGELAWSAGEGILSYCSTQLVQLGGVEQLLITTEAGLTAFQPATGEILWAHSWPTEGVARVVQPALLSGTDLLIGTGMGVGTRRISVSHESDSWPIKEQWTSKSIKPYYNDLVVHEDYLYGFDGNIFMCVGLSDGRPKWKARGYGNGQVLLLVDQGLLLVLSEEGDVALLAADPKEHRELARFKAIDGKTWNHPVVAHGKLFVRNGEEAACFELTPAVDEKAQAGL